METKLRKRDGVLGYGVLDCDACIIRVDRPSVLKVEAADRFERRQIATRIEASRSRRWQSSLSPM
jgi:hypothetical protein